MKEQIELLSLEEYPELQEAKDRFTKIHLDARENRGKIDALSQKIYAETESASHHDIHLEEAYGLISGGENAELIESVSLNSMRKEMGTLKKTEGVLNRALELQQQIVTKLQGKYSVIHSQKLKPLYDKRARRMALAMLEFAKAAQEEDNFRQQLIMNDISFQSVFEPMNLPRLGLLKNPNSLITQYLSKLNSAGHLTNKEVA